jgi:LuxR family quorum sensing-dependent transcriptional regulator
MSRHFSAAAIDFALQLGQQATPAGVADDMARLIADFGIESLTFCGIPNGRQDFTDALSAKKWSDDIVEWFSEYTSKGYIRSDPIALQVKCTSRPFLWSDIHVDPDRSSEGAALMKRRKDYGFNDAFVVPVHSPKLPPAFVSMSGFRMELPADARLSAHLIALCAFERIREISSPQVAKPLLTPREREVLSWAAEGKSAWEIGLILKIAKRTVDEHAQAAARKLNACSRAHAVAIAIKNHYIFV